MRIGAGLADYSTGVARSTGVRGRKFSKMESDTTRVTDESRMAAVGDLIRQSVKEENDREEQQAGGVAPIDGQATGKEAAADRGEAVKIYEEVFKGGENPIENLRPIPKVPYGHLANGGVIIYNGVLFTCDERTNSICLGDVTDRKQTINITLSGGGHLKVNRSNLGQLSKAIGMFSPEDVNLIMRAIHQDTKVQSMQKEIEDLEAGVGEQIASGEDTAETDGDKEEE